MPGLAIPLTFWYACASSVSLMINSTFSSPPISLCISFKTAVPCCRPKTTSFCTKANSTSEVRACSCASCWSVFVSSDSWYFFRRRASSALSLRPSRKHSRATSVSRSVTILIRFWYCCSLSRWTFISSMALGHAQRKPCLERVRRTYLS